MLILTVQNKSFIDSVIYGNKGYDLFKSNFAFSSPRYLTGYLLMQRMLGKKIKVKDPEMIWGWACHPYLVLHNNQNLVDSAVSDEDPVVSKDTLPVEQKYAVFLDIDENKCILSDYNTWCKYLNEESDDLYASLKDIDSSNSIQCVFTRDAIKKVRLIADFNIIKKLEGYSVSALLQKAKSAII